MKVAVLSFAQECAAAYVRALRALPGVDVITADPGGPPGDPARGRSPAEGLGVARADSWDEVFALRPGAVVVTGGTAHRRELVERAARAGAHVLCEPPLAPEVADAQAMVDACRDAGVRLTLASPACFGPAFAAVRRAVAGGDAVGRLMSVHGAYDTGTGPAGTPAPAGRGVLAALAPYLLDMVDTVLGGAPAERVYAQTNSVLGDEGGAESAALVSVRYAGGTVAAVDCARVPSADPSATGGPTLTFVGDTGSVEFTVSPRLLGGFDAATGAERWEAGGDDPVAVMLGEFVAAAGGGPRTGPDGATGVRTMRIIQAAYESVRTGQPVDLAVAPAGRRA